MNRRFLTDKDKLTIGVKCVNCGSKEDLIYHHIVPLSLGGFDVNSNMVCLCGLCHKIVHGNKTNRENFNHSELVKKGMENARKNGVRLGRKKTVFADIPTSFKKIYPDIKNNSMTITEASKKMECSRNTIYKYIEIMDKAK